MKLVDGKRVKNFYEKIKHAIGTILETEFSTVKTLWDQIGLNIEIANLATSKTPIIFNLRGGLQ